MATDGLGLCGNAARFRSPRSDCGSAGGGDPGPGAADAAGLYAHRRQLSRLNPGIGASRLAFRRVRIMPV